MFQSILALSVGLAMLFFGMQFMKSGLENAAQHRLRMILQRLTKTPLTGMLTGTLITALVQSSTAVTVLSIGFVNARLMTFEQALGIILGTNIGTCITAQLISLDLHKLAIPAIGLGALIMWLSKGRGKYVGQAILGFGVAFLGMSVLGEALQPLKDYPPFIHWLTTLSQNYLLAVVAGTVFSALIHSSSTTTGVVMALSSQGLVDLPAAIAIVFGSNIGTCITGLLASFGTNRSAQRVAMSHVMLNVGGVALFLPFLGPFTTLMAETASELPRQIANAHTIFNIASSVILLPFISQFSQMLFWIVPDRNKLK